MKAAFATLHRTVHVLAMAAFLATPAMLRADLWTPGSQGPGQRIAHTTIFTGAEVIVWGGGRQGTWLADGARYHPLTDTWTPLSTSHAPSGRWFHAAVWTGTEMIVWGGRANFFPENHFADGARYNPLTDTWTPISTVGAPSARSQMAAVWTGSEMIVWGGTGDGFDEKSDGARYNPQTDTWTPLPAAPLAGRIEPTGVWTGTELILFGGMSVDGYLFNEHWSTFGDGARFNPATGSWTLVNPQGAPASRTAHTAVWTGSEMLVWGGRFLPDQTFHDSGAAYDPAQDAWTPISTRGAPLARAQHAAIWTGSEMIVWGGYVDLTPQEVSTGARYNPLSRTWAPTTDDGAPDARYFARPDAAVWTGEALFIYGGWNYPIELNSTALYFPAGDPPPPPPQNEFWEPRANGTAPRVAHTTVFTGDEIIVWGGGRQSQWLDDGGRYDLHRDVWRPTSRQDAPAGRWWHAAVWTGSEMIVFGGRANFYPENHWNTGGRYNPRTDRWRPISTVGAPSARSQMAAVWTGSEMIVWGGTGDAFDEKADGGRYDPHTDTWRPLAPSPLDARTEPTAVWTGTEMLIFGGLKVDGYLFNEHWSTFGDGARYDPATDTWRRLNAAGAPSSRTAHTAVWTGSEMMIWGGRYLPDYTFLHSGAAYDPARDAWTPVSTLGAPQARAFHAGVWSGTEMIIWGGYVDPSPSEVNTGARYNPVSRVWTPTTLVGAPQPRFFGRSDNAIWTGQAMFIHAGWNYPNELNSTFLYYPESIAGALLELARLLEGPDVPRKAQRILQAALDVTLDAVQRGNVHTAINHLTTFQHKVEVQIGDEFPALAEALITGAKEIITRLGAE